MLVVIDSQPDGRLCHLSMTRAGQKEKKRQDGNAHCAAFYLDSQPSRVSGCFGTTPAQMRQDRRIYGTLATGLYESCTVNAALC